MSGEFKLVKVERFRRIYLPKRFCERLGIGPGDYVKVYVEGSRLVIEKVRA